jgi:hypothetical protein
MAQLKAYDEGTSQWVPLLGSQGPAGPTGPTGPIGPTGPTGNTGSTPTSDDDQLIIAIQVFG